jgi:hypothetical protein
MSTSGNSSNLSAALFGKTRRAVLSLLYSHADEAFYLREIARAAGVGLGAVQRELRQLSDAGIIQRTVRGNQVYYQANKESPVFAELRGVVTAVAHNDQPLRAATASAQHNAMSKGLSERSKHIVVPRDEIAEFCQRNHIRRLHLFGSALRDDFRPDSDVDVLVEFEPGHVPGFFRLFDMEMELSALFSGRKVDLRTPQDLSRYFRDEVLATAELHYAR